MVEQYGKSVDYRGTVLKSCPVLLKIAYRTLHAEIDKEIDRLKKISRAENPKTAGRADPAFRHLDRLKQEATTWCTPDLGIAYTDAAEMLASEFKFRALLWCVEKLRDIAARKDLGLAEEAYSAAEGLVNQLNNFVLDYENGAYPPRTLLGQLHRSIAPVAKALEPIIWARSLDGRWGRRVLRLGIAAEHFNDVVKRHRSNSLTWSTPLEKKPVVVHPATTIDVYGREIVRNDIPAAPRLLPDLRLQFRTFYWRLVGKLELKPSVWIWSFGGRRLRRHMRHEDQLSACLRFALASKAGSTPVSVSFSWTLDTLRHDMARDAKSKISTTKRGRLAWLYLRRRGADG